MGLCSLCKADISTRVSLDAFIGSLATLIAGNLVIGVGLSKLNAEGATYIPARRSPRSLSSMCYSCVEKWCINSNTT